MLIEWILELKDSIDKHGLRLGVVFTLYAIYRKEKRNNRLDRRDIDLFHNDFVIMKALGVEKEWRGQLKISSDTDLMSLKRLLQSLTIIRRIKKMGTINKQILIPLISCVALIVKYATGYTFPQQGIDMASDIILAIVNLIGILMHPVKQDSTAIYKGDSGSAV